MRKTSILVAVAALAVVSAAQLSAQAVDRQGLYVDVGVNYSMGLNTAVITGASGEAIGQTADVAGYVLGVGMGLKNNMWRLGLQGDMFKQSNFAGSDADMTANFYTLAATYYPNANTGFWARLNLGYGTDKLSTSGSIQGGTSSGLAGGFGVGYDWMLGEKSAFVVAPYLSYMSLLSGGDFGGDLSGAKARVGVMQIGVTIGYKH